MLGLVVFFTAFNLLEASLPSLISKGHRPAAKGRRWACIPPASSLARLSGRHPGWLVLYQHYSLSGVFAAVPYWLFWLAFAVTMREPPYVTSLRLAAFSGSGFVKLDW